MWKILYFWTKKPSPEYRSGRQGGGEITNLRLLRNLTAAKHKGIVVLYVVAKILDEAVIESILE